MTRPLSFSRHRLLIDTSAYYALADSHDSGHRVATVIAEQVREKRWPTITTNFIIAETHALVLNRLGRAIAIRVLEAIDLGAAVVVRVTVADERRAREIIRHYHDKTFSLTDATSFSVMERLNITHVFSLDNDFTQYGFTALTPTLFGEQ